MRGQIGRFTPAATPPSAAPRAPPFCSVSPATMMPRPLRFMDTPVEMTSSYVAGLKLPLMPILDQRPRTFE